MTAQKVASASWGTVAAPPARGSVEKVRPLSEEKGRTFVLLLLLLL
ncbi:hypothetical protein [Streptomyces sp. NPDC002587]